MFYIINGRVIIKNLDDISQRGYFMGYAATTWFILFWKTDYNFVIHISHNDWFDEYNSSLSIEDNNTPSYLPLKKDTESLIHNSDLLNCIPCEIDLTSTPFHDTTILTYEIELPASGKKVGFNLLDDEDFTIPFITDKILN